MSKSDDSNGDKSNESPVIEIIQGLLETNKTTPIIGIAIACVHEDGCISSVASVMNRATRPPLLGSIEIVKARIMLREMQDTQKDLFTEALATEVATRESFNATKQ